MVFNPNFFGDDGKKDSGVFKVDMGMSLRLSRLERTLNSLIDDFLALHALMIVRGHYTHEDVVKMHKIVADARQRLGASFTIEEGLRVIQASFKIEMAKEQKKDAE